jgi:hypothetical protein
MTPKELSKQNESAAPMRYVGAGAFVHGVPARDLAAEEWNALTPEQREAAKDLYRAADNPQKSE